MFTRKAVFSAHGRAAVIATIAAVALPQPQLLPVLSGPDLRSPQRRAAPPTTATMAAPPITAEIHIIMAVVPTITADMAMAACPTIGAIP